MLMSRNRINKLLAELATSIDWTKAKQDATRKVSRARQDMEEAEHKAKLDAPEAQLTSTLASARRREDVEVANMNQVAWSYIDRATFVVSRIPPVDLNRDASDFHEPAWNEFRASKTSSPTQSSQRVRGSTEHAEERT
jgi:hypothetical protein